MKLSSNKPIHNKFPGQSNSGQVVVEYVLLLVVAVAIAALITKSMVNRNPEEPGFVIGAWNRIIQTIGSDLADEPTIREQQQ